MKVMRTIKVPFEKFKSAVEKLVSERRPVAYMPIPSSSGKHTFQGLLMPAGIWVAWPVSAKDDEENGLTEEQFKFYLERYGDIPDLFTPKSKVLDYKYDPGDLNED